MKHPQFPLGRERCSSWFWCCWGSHRCVQWGLQKPESQSSSTRYSWCWCHPGLHHWHRSHSCWRFSRHSNEWTSCSACAGSWVFRDSFCRHAPPPSGRFGWRLQGRWELRLGASCHGWWQASVHCLHPSRCWPVVILTPNHSVPYEVCRPAWMLPYYPEPLRQSHSRWHGGWRFSSRTFFWAESCSDAPWYHQRFRVVDSEKRCDWYLEYLCFPWFYQPCLDSGLRNVTRKGWNH